MKIKAKKCPSCGDTIYSRTETDQRSCTCEAINVRGMDGPLQTGWDPEQVAVATIATVELDLDVTAKILYEDWHAAKNKYGLIPQTKKAKKRDK
jgi:hypothetical protein